MLLRMSPKFISTCIPALGKHCLSTTILSKVFAVEVPLSGKHCGNGALYTCSINEEYLSSSKLLTS